MFLEIITVEKKLFSGDVKLVKLPGSKGSFEILKNHAAIISTLDKGKIKVVKTDGEQEFYDIASGVIEATNNNIVVLAEMV
ncbi:MAG: ATP synthase F1 subunit epsilon [Chlorobi bacterium]|nr:ATP synthase F1 subunit epsilon [Chlorobiota bacterium]